MSSIRTTHPQLAEQLVDQTLADQLTAGSGKKVQWRCPIDPRHLWSAPVYSRAAGSGCPVCAGKLILEGVNDLATTHPALASQLVDPADGRRYGAGTRTVVAWQCPDHRDDTRHRWDASIKNRVNGRGCPICANKLTVEGINDLATTHPDLAAELADPDLATTLNAGSTKAVDWKCAAHGHPWTARLVDRAGGNGCPICSGHRVHVGVNDLATTHPDLASQLVDHELATTVSAGSVKILQWRCSEHPEHVWPASVTNRIAGNGCAVCSNQFVQQGVNDLATTHPEIAAQMVDPQIATEVTAGSKRVVEWQCQTSPDHRWLTACYHLTGPNPTRCPKCFGPRPSQAEERLAEVVAALIEPATLLTSHRGVLEDGLELDMFVPELKLAIEFNGLFWHSDGAGRSNDYHQRKTLAAGRAGIRLIHVWEDDWRDRPEIVTRMLAHRLHALDRLPAILPDADPRVSETRYARVLTPDVASAREAREFLTAHHIQGPTPLTRSFALRDDEGQIRALLGLRSPQNNARMKRQAGQWEIQRYATVGAVPGGFTRLIAHAARTLRAEGVDLRSWVSFSADDISDGGMYRAAGFTPEARLSPDYRYVGNFTGWTRVPKERFQRRRFREDEALLWDESWTEREAAARNKLFRIYDAGKTRWTRPA